MEDAGEKRGTIYEFASIIKVSAKIFMVYGYIAIEI
jgi:hypothetical protein